MIYMPINHGVVHLLTSFIDHITTILYPIASPYFIMCRWLYKYTMLTFVNKGAGLYSMFTPGNKVHVVREMHQNRCGGFLAEKRVAQLISRHGFVLLIAFFLLVFQSFQPETLPAAHKKIYHSMSVYKRPPQAPLLHIWIVLKKNIHCINLKPLNK